MRQSDPIEIIIAGVPVAKGRARYSSRGGSIRVYTPDITRMWAEEAQFLARHVMGSRKPLQGPLRVELEFCFPVPRSWGNWKREAALDGRIKHTVKPDRDNLEKNLKDALNGIVWVDDSQVVQSGGIGKIYGTVPMVRAVVYQLEGFAPASIKNRRELIQWTEEVG